MESIGLTPHQRVKLLAMISYLFPKYHKDVYYKGTEGNEDYLASKCARPNFEILLDGTFVKIPKFEEGDSEPLKYNVQFNYIHWFEFCIKHLIPKLDEGIQDIIDSRILFCELPNPIDYLYEQFLKLKK